MRILSLLLTLPILSQAFVAPASSSTSQYSFGLQVVSEENNDVHIHNIIENNIDQSRRNVFQSAAATALGFATMASQSQMQPAMAATGDVKKVLVLGATGFVGSQVCAKLKSLGIEVVGTSRDGRVGTSSLDFMDSSKQVAKEVEALAAGCDAVVSCIGSIGTPNDGQINAGTGLAAVGAKAAGVKRFVYVSVAPEVRDATQGISFLKDYMKGKTSSEQFIRQNFESSYMLIEPTFIYGGDTFNLNPPRVAGFYGQFVESVLSSGLFRAAAKVSPGIIGIALEPPISVQDVAGAAVAGVFGYSSPVLDTYDKIREASASLN